MMPLIASAPPFFRGGFDAFTLRSIAALSSDDGASPLGAARLPKYRFTEDRPAGRHRDASSAPVRPLRGPAAFIVPLPAMPFPASIALRERSL